MVISILITSTLCVDQSSSNQKLNYLVKQLETAEQEKDIKQIENLFSEEAIILLPDSPPIAGNKAICALYEFIWAKNRKETSEYLVDSVAKNGKEITEYGQFVATKENQQKEVLPFHAKFELCEKDWLITELNFGNCIFEEQMPHLPNPTGDYNIGQTTFFYKNKQTSINRDLSFQVWFPTLQKKGKKLKYRSPQAAEASAQFLGWSIFGNSFVTLIETNSFQNARVVPNKKSPVLLYNHGYGGFSSVYQTVFEELASHGYIVVSIGHQDESALLQIDDENVIPNSPENEFYTKRSAELNGRKINELQSTVLNSDNRIKITEAYQELLKHSPLHKESVELWAKDTEEVIRELAKVNHHNKKLQGALDLENIGVFGHSVGGATSGELAYNCPQVKAGINLDGFQFGNLIDNKLQVPFLFVSSNSSGNTYLRVSPFINSSESQCCHVVIQGFNHDTFSDIPVIMNNNHAAIKIQRSLILGYFNYVFGRISFSSFQKELSAYKQIKMKFY